MKYIKLDKEETKLEADYEKGKYKSVAGSSKAKEQYREYAQFTLDKTRNINIRLSEKDLLKFKAKAAKKGLPYQTLASSVLHQYVSE